MLTILSLYKYTTLFLPRRFTVIINKYKNVDLTVRDLKTLRLIIEKLRRHLIYYKLLTKL